MNTNEVTQLINRIKNVKNLTDEVLQCVRKLSYFVQTKMEDAGLTSLQILNHSYSVNTVHANTGRETSLYYTVRGTQSEVHLYENKEVCLECTPSRTRALAYLFDDYNAPYHRPSRSDILTFLHTMPEILKELSSYEQAA